MCPQPAPATSAETEGAPYLGSTQHPISLLWWQTGLPAPLGPMKQFVALEKATLKSTGILERRIEEIWLFGVLGFIQMSTRMLIWKAFPTEGPQALEKNEPQVLYFSPA